jgi:hypothetical protein
MARRGLAKAGQPLKDTRFVSCIRLFDDIAIRTLV